MSTTTEYFSMQGRVALGILNADGSRKPAQFVYDSSKLEWAFSQDKSDKQESYSGTRGLAAQLVTKRSMKVTLTLGELNDSNAALSIAGTTVQITAGTVTAESIGDVKAGDMVALDFAKVSSVALTDGTSAALVADTDYTLHADTGVLTFLTTKAGVTGNYEYAAHSLVTAFTGGKQNMYVLFDGMNTVEGTDMLVRGEVYKIIFDPASTFGLIQSDFGELELSGDARADATRLSNDKYGGYARVMLLDPTPAP